MSDLLAMAVVSTDGTLPARSPEMSARLIREPQEIRAGDELLLFHGPRMARQVMRFSARAPKSLPPMAVPAPGLDVADAAPALDHGVATYLPAPQCPNLLAVALHHTARGGSILASPPTGSGRGRPGGPR